MFPAAERYSCCIIAVSFCQSFIITIEWSNKSETLRNVTRCSCSFSQHTCTLSLYARFWVLRGAKYMVNMFFLFRRVAFLCMCPPLILLCHCSVFNIFATISFFSRLGCCCCLFSTPDKILNMVAISCNVYLLLQRIL